MNNNDQIINSSFPFPGRYYILYFLGFYLSLIIVFLNGIDFNYQNKVDNQYSSSVYKRNLMNTNSNENPNLSSFKEKELENIPNEDDNTNHTNDKDIESSNKSSNNILNENTNLSAKDILPTFFEVIQSKFYKGKWKSTNNPTNFINSEGGFEIRFFLENVTYLNYPKMSVRFKVRDGYYFGSYLDFEIWFQMKINPPLNDNVIFNLRSALFELKGSEYFTEKSYYSKIF